MSTRNFGAQLLTLRLVFENHFFNIPDYQRSYSWEEEQVNDLIKDIEHLMSDGVYLRHYTGTLVLSQQKGRELGTFDIVDGQQRLTTLVIFMKAISLYLDPCKKQDVEARYLWRGNIGSERYVLRLNTDTRMFHEKVVLGDANTANNPPNLESHERLLRARSIIDKWLAEKMKNDSSSAAKVLESLETELGFLVYAPMEDAETGIMFEVINNRGKQLSELEKVKNYLIYCCVKLSANSLRETINSDWSVVLKNLNDAKKTSTSDEGAFLRYCVAVYYKSNKSDSQYGYNELKKALKIDSAMNDDNIKAMTIESIRDFVEFLKTASLWYKRLYGRKHNGCSPKIIPILDQIRAQQQHASIMPLFLSLVIKSQDMGDSLVHLLGLLEIVNFRVYMAANRTYRNDAGQGELYRYASRFYHNELLGDFGCIPVKIGRTEITSEEKALEYRLVEFTLNYATDERFESSFSLEKDSPDDFYKWDGLRYFLMNYEAMLQPNRTIYIDQILLSRQQVKSGDYLSVEHLWAQKNRIDEGENNREIDKHEKKRLGNFVLLELRSNIQGSHEGLEQKLPIYVGKSGSPEATN